MYEGVVEKSFFGILVISLILINLFSLTRSTIFWSIYNQTFYCLLSLFSFQNFNFRSAFFLGDIGFTKKWNLLTFLYLFVYWISFINKSFLVIAVLLLVYQMYFVLTLLCYSLFPHQIQPIKILLHFHILKTISIGCKGAISSIIYLPQVRPSVGYLENHQLQVFLFNSFLLVFIFMLAYYLFMYLD